MAETITEEDKSLLPGLIQVWERFDKEQRYLVFGYANGVADATPDRKANE